MPPTRKHKLGTQDQRGSKRWKGAQATTANERTSSPSYIHSPQVGDEKPVTTTSSSFNSQGTNKESVGAITKVTQRDTVEKEEASCSSQALTSTVKPRKDFLSKSADMLTEFLMFRFKKQKPILKSEMLKVIGEKYKSHFPEILKRASFTIEVVFGTDLKETESPMHSYNLVSKIDLPNNGRVSPGRGFPKTGLLINILGVIFIKGNIASEDIIWEFLNKMKIYAGERHFIYGDSKKLITEDFVRLNYLNYHQIPNSDPPRYEFMWGPKSHASISKMQVLEFWAKINNIAPSAFLSRYEEALKDQESNTVINTNISQHYQCIREYSVVLTSVPEIII